MSDTFLLAVLTLDSTLRLAAPLILAALAGMFAVRSGVIDIGLEGKMLAAAFAFASASASASASAAMAMAAVSQSAWLGLGAGIIISIALAMLHGFACITHRGNQVVSGLAINILVSGLTIILGIAWFHQGGQTPSLVADARFGTLEWPLATAIADVPFIGTIYVELLSGHNLLVYMAFLAVPSAWWLLYRTRFGLRLRAVGENPAAADTAGISVSVLRYQAMAICGLLCGVAGAYLPTAHGAAFVRDMTAGKGYIA